MQTNVTHESKVDTNSETDNTVITTNTIRNNTTDASTESIEDLIPLADRIIPNRAYVFGSLIQSTEVRDMRNIANLTKHSGDKATTFYNNDETTGTASTSTKSTADHITPYRAPEAENCQGGALLIPVHWEQIKRRGGKELSKSHKLAEFNFYQRNQPKAPEQGIITEITVLTDGVVHGMLIYWETMLLSLSLDPTESLSYSTSPSSTQIWQDHWVQVNNRL